MHLVGIEGKYGGGKTTTAVVKAHMWAMRTGAKIFANFPLRGAYLFESYQDWYRVADAHGSILIFDESGMNWDGRKWNTQGQTEQTQVVNYVRKMNSIFIFILPDFSDLESRVRNKTDILVHCKKSKNGGIVNYVFDQTLKQDKLDKGKLVNKWYLPKQSLEKIWKLKLFNTFSMVHKFPTPPPNMTDRFFKELDKRHTAAIERRYGKIEMTIETLIKEELLNVETS